ncbi:interleukin-27 subunit beta [Pygocentrus nattereri]|uniref:Fibronectin type-III domain-containing protein n=1 Tax=Pygocentrus nattereri TaxID=42514 RepID=A0A3B4D798_PYGNA|nr:interleukin-27 subunit beta [Pygocentrus nattereri]
MYVKHCIGTLIVLIAFFCQVWSQETTNEPPKQRPTKDIYLGIGSWADLPCTDGISEGLQWRRNGSLVGSGPVLNIRNASLGDKGIYTCHGPNGDTIEMLHLHLGYAPSPPEVQCWIPSYPLKALCSWTQTPDPLLPTHYITTYWSDSEEQLPAVHSCQKQREQDRQCVVEGVDLNPDTQYLVNITAVNALGSATRILSISLEDIVKPDPPVDVKATALPGKKVQVQWAPPPTWTDPVTFPLKYKVHFYWGNPNLDSTLGPYETDSMVRSGLPAGRTYQIRVSAMDFLGYGLSSEWSDPVSITLPKS